MKRKYSSIPFIPIKSSNIDKAVENEIILDVDKNKLYIKKEDKKDFIEDMEDRLQDDDLADDSDRLEYGIKIDMTESNPEAAISYIEDAIGFNPLKVDKGTGNCNYGSWEKIISNFFGVEPVLVKDDKVIAKLDPDNIDKKLEIPFTEKKIYGFNLDFETNNLTYTDDAVALSSMIMIDNEIEYGDWKDILYNLIGIKPVGLSEDKKEIYDVDPYDYKKIVSQSNITEDNIMIRFKHLYYFMDITADHIIFKIASYKPDDTFVDTIFNKKDAFYVSAYNASLDINGHAVSRSGKASKITHGDSYYTEDIVNKYLYLLCLGILIGDSANLSTLGIDNNSENSDKYTGSLDEAGEFATSNNTTKTFGAENLFGNHVEVGAATAYADGSSIRYIIEDDTVEEIKRIIRIEAKDLSYDNLSNFKFCTGQNGLLISINVPARIFI